MNTQEIVSSALAGKGWQSLSKFSRFIFPLILLVIISVVTPSFFTVNNGINILRQSSILFILAAGQTLVILTEGIDLSVGAILGMTACLAGGIIIKGGNNYVGIALALILGATLGLFNGVMVSFGKLPAFVATYGMMMLARGLTIAYMQGNVYWGFNPAFRFLGAGSVGPFPVPIILAFLIFVIFFVLLHYSRLGRSIYYIGNNRRAALMSGFKVNRILMLVYALEGTIAAIGGVIYLSRLNSADASLGTGFELNVIAAVVIGGTSFFKAEGNLINAVIGAIIISILNNAMILLGISSYWQPFVIGFLIVLITAVERVTEKARSSTSIMRDYERGRRKEVEDPKGAI